MRTLKKESFARIFAGHSGYHEINLLEDKFMTKELREFCRLHSISRIVDLSEFVGYDEKKKVIRQIKKFLEPRGFCKSTSTFLEKFDEMLKKRKKKMIKKK